MSVSLLKDIYPGATGSGISQGIYINGKYIFAASDGSDPRQLWTSDGTAAGTVPLLSNGIVTNVNPELTHIGSEVYFTAATSAGLGEVWMTNGTPAGTVLIDPLTSGGSAFEFAGAGSHIFFAVQQSMGVKEYATDGTPAGSVVLNVPGSQFVTPVTFGNDVLFRSDNASTNAHELWISDGTVAGTKILASFSSNAALSNIAVMNGEAYFAGSDSTHGTELWKTDGTPAGTMLANDLAPGTASSDPTDLVTVGSALYFVATPVGGAEQVWKSDGSVAGTAEVTNVSTAAHSGNFLGSITPFGSRVLFQNVGDLYVTDGTIPGTSELAIGGISDGSSDAHIPLSSFVVSGPYAYFNQNGANGYELSRTDGTVAGTSEIADINPTPAGAYPIGSSYPVGFIAGPPGATLFSASDGVHGSEPYLVIPDTAVATGSTITLPPSASGPTVLVTGLLSIAGSADAWTGKLDITNNDVDVSSSSLATVSNEVKQGLNAGNWSGLGITSSVAASDSNHLTAVATIQNNQSGIALFTSTNAFDGTVPGVADVLLKYTYYGDANLDGKVDASDYSRIDNGYLQHLTGWFNGDFNYDGVVNGSDYTLMDNVFNTQGASLAARIAPASRASEARSPVVRPATISSPATSFVFQPPDNVSTEIFAADPDDRINRTPFSSREILQ